MIAELIYKVEYGEESIEENLRDIFDKKSI